MHYITRCVKRRNTVKLFLNTKTKKMVESIYMVPENRLIRRRLFTGNTLEEVAGIYFAVMNRYSTLGYEVEEKKDGKVISIEFQLKESKHIV
ncbi:hypothetical protein [Defluviitalea saccharophila]|uniref:Uncharacterized protein n=1 Tax=Defluviitalea saccharophila TaxID=879970 RepID=A0ABZ2Y729_9FIRM|nr:hypothetical protein [Candidatus Epulonipiscium sp.]